MRGVAPGREGANISLAAYISFGAVKIIAAYGPGVVNTQLRLLALTLYQLPHA